MSVLRIKSAAVAAVLLAALAFTGLVAQGHDHDLVVGAHGHSDSPTYSGGHDQVIPTTHIEEATRIESSSCLACIQQQRQRGAGSRPVTFSGVEPSSSNLELEGDGQAVAGISRLPGSRAPPSA